MTTETKPLHIVELRSENVKRIRAVTIRPNGSTVVIGGENAQGKSSLLDAIEMALAGARAIPQEPIRHGARKAKIRIDLGEFVVERTFTSNGRTQLVVTGKDGLEMASPQKILDGLCAKVTFDPLEFSRMDAPKQDALLKTMIGLDLSDIEAARKKVYDQRTEANREQKRLETVLDDLEWHSDVPAEPVSVAALTMELQGQSGKITERAIAVAKVESLKVNLAERQARVLELRKKADELEAECTSMAASIETSETNIPVVPTPAEIEKLQACIRDAEAINAKVRANAEHKKIEAQLTAKTAEIEECKSTIESLDEEKGERLSKAKFPVEGLGFDDAGPTFKGVPLAQASQAERIRVSVGIGAELNPRIKIMLVREASFLDDASMALIAELAVEKQCQFWLERVGTKDPGAIIISDGQVVDAPAQETAAAS